MRARRERSQERQERAVSAQSMEHETDRMTQRHTPLGAVVIGLKMGSHFDSEVGGPTGGGGA